MKQTWTHRTAAACMMAGALGAAWTTPAAAAYPDRPVTLVVPFAPGGATDQLARLLGVKMSERLGTTVVVENKPGAGTVVAAAYVAKAPADGYTLFLSSNSTLVLNPAIRTQLPYDPLKSYTYVSRVAQMELLLVGGESLKQQTLAEVIDHVRKKPDDLSYGSYGTGTTVHFGAEMFKAAAGLEITHVPFNGSTPNLTALIGGQIPLAADTQVATLPHIRAGKIRPLAIMSSQRSALLPDVPTIAESGYPGFEMTSWFAMLAPAGLDEGIRAKLDDTFRVILADADTQRRMVDMGLSPRYGTGPELQAQTRDELPRMQQVAQTAGITPQ